MSVNLFDKFAPILVCAVWVWLSVRTTKSLQTITRHTVAHTRRVVWLIKLLATLVVAGSVFGIALNFHLNWFASAVMSAVVVLLALTDKVEAIVPGKPSQHPSAYSEAWKEYRRLRKNSYIAAIIFVLILLSGFPLTATIGPDRGFLIAAAAASGVSVVYSCYTWKMAYWPCPRCGYRFRSLWVPVMPKQCNHCGLALWGQGAGVSATNPNRGTS